MTNRKLQSSFALFSLLALGFTAPATADVQSALSLEKLRFVRGTDGIGFGSLVMPTYTELGQLSANLYDESDRPAFVLDGAMSLYIPSGTAEYGSKFGGFTGNVREAHSVNGAHPMIVGWVEGTWAVNAKAKGTLDAVVYKFDANDNLYPFGVILGEFEIVLINVGGQVEPETLVMGSGLSGNAQQTKGAGQASSAPIASGNAQLSGGSSQATSPGFRYTYLRAMRTALNQAQLSPRFWSSAQPAKNHANSATFARRSAAIQASVAQARRKAEQNAAPTSPLGASGSGPLTLNTIPVEVHYAGKILIKFKWSD